MAPIDKAELLRAAASRITKPLTVGEWSSATDPQNIQVFKNVFEGEGVDPRLRGVRVLVNGRYVKLEDIVIGHHGMIDNNPTALMLQSQILIGKARSAVRALEGIAAEGVLEGYITGENIPLLDIGEGEGIKGGKQLLSFIKDWGQQQKGLLVGENAIGIKDLKISYAGRDLVNIHKQWGGTSDATFLAARSSVQEIFEAIGMSPAEAAELAGTHHYAEQWINPNQAKGVLGLSTKELEIFKIASLDRYHGTTGLDTLQELQDAGLFNEVGTDDNVSKLIKSLNRKRFTNIYRHPIHGPGSAFQGIFYVSEDIEFGSTVTKHWMSATNYADYDGDLIGTMALRRGEQSPQAFMDTIKQLIHLKSSTYHASDEAWVLMDYTMKDYRSNLSGAIIGMSEEKGVTPELVDLLNIESKGKVRLSDLLGITVEGNKFKQAGPDELLRMQAKAIKTLGSNPRTELVDLLEQGVRGVGDIASGFGDDEYTATVLHTLFGPDALTKGGFIRANLDDFVDPTTGVLSKIVAVNQEAAIKAYTGARMIGKYVNIVQGNVFMMRKYAEDDALLATLATRAGEGDASYAERMILDIFNPGGGPPLGKKERSTIVDAMTSIQSELDLFTIKAMKGSEIDISAYKYVHEIMNAVIETSSYGDLEGFDFEGGAPLDKLLNLYSHTGAGGPSEGLDAFLIVKKFKSGQLRRGDALTAKFLMLFTAFNTMTDEDRSVMMLHSLGKPAYTPSAAEEAIYNVLGARSKYIGLPVPGGPLSGYRSFQGINLTEPLAHNIQYVEGMEEIPIDPTGKKVFKFAVPSARYGDDLDDAMRLDIATHFMEATDKEEIKVHKMHWEYTPARRDEYGNKVRVGDKEATSELLTGRHLFDPEGVRGVLERKTGAKGIGSGIIKDKIYENLGTMNDLEIDPGQKLGTHRRIRIRGFSSMLREATKLGGEEAAAKVYADIAGELYYEHGLVIAGEPGTGIQNALSGTGNIIPSEVLHIDPRSPGLLGLTRAELGDQVSEDYEPILDITAAARRTVLEDIPYIKYGAQSLVHGRYLWEDPYMHNYLINLDAGGGKLGLINWLQYQAFKETPGMFPNFRVGTVERGNAPVIVNTAIILGGGPSTSGATLTPLGATLKTGDQVYTQMKFSNQEVPFANELLQRAAGLEFGEGGISISKSGNITIDFSKAVNTDEAWDRFMAQLKFVQGEEPSDVAYELLEGQNYGNMKWRFTKHSIDNLLDQSRGEHLRISSLDDVTDLNIKSKYLRDIFSKIGMAYESLRKGKDTFSFNWEVENRSPVALTKFISGITKVMVGVSPWEHWEDPNLRGLLQSRNVSVVMGPDIKQEGLSAALADTLHVRWLENYLEQHGTKFRLSRVGDSLEIVTKGGTPARGTEALKRRLMQSKSMIDDIVQEELATLVGVEDDRSLKLADTSHTVKQIIGRINKDLKGQMASKQRDIHLDQILTSTKQVDGSPVHALFLSHNITQQQPTNLSRGIINISLEQLARIWGSGNPEEVLRSTLGSVVYSQDTKKTVLASAALRKARNVYGGRVEGIIGSARAALDAAEDDVINVVYAQQLTKPGPTPDEPYSIIPRAIEDISGDIDDQKVMILADDMKQAEVVKRAIRDKASKVVSFVGEEFDKDISLDVMRLSGTYPIGATEEVGSLVHQAMMDAGLATTDEVRLSAKGLHGRAAVGAIFKLVREGAPGAVAVSPTEIAQQRMLSEIAGDLLGQTIPFLSRYWKPIAGIAAGLVGLGAVHRMAAAGYEDAQPEEYVPASQATRRIPMMRDNSGYSRQTTRQRGVRPQHPGTMRIEPETNIIVNDEEYVDSHRLSRMLDRYLG